MAMNACRMFAPSVDERSAQCTVDTAVCATYDVTPRPIRANW
jgi:hypothetical protein